MEQRPLRLGDILDDYCPRERRVTNHAVVAMIAEAVRQTRCTTCDAEHVYKGAKVPRRRKKDAPDALYQEVLAGMPEVDAGLVAPAALVSAPTDAAPERTQPPVEMIADAPDDTPAAETGEPPAAPAEEGPVHRPLIRATLPRPEGQKEARKEPDFTMRQPLARPGRFRGGDVRTRPRGFGTGYGGQGNGNGGAAGGNRPNAGPRFGGPRPSGHGGRFRSGGGRKRGR